MTIDPLSALALFLPEHTLDHFDITKASFEGGEIRLTLTEKAIPPKHEGAPLHFHSYRDILVSDYPVRGNPSVLTFRRRYWKADDQKELLGNDLPLVFPGTKLEKAFAAFLKEGGGDRTGLLGEYRHFKQS